MAWICPQEPPILKLRAWTIAKPWRSLPATARSRNSILPTGLNLIYGLCELIQPLRCEMPGINACDLQSNPRFLFRQPRALQWFDNGALIKRQDEERQAGESQELDIRATIH